MVRTGTALALLALLQLVVIGSCLGDQDSLTRNQQRNEINKGEAAAKEESRNLHDTTTTSGNASLAPTPTLNCSTPDDEIICPEFNRTVTCFDDCEYCNSCFAYAAGYERDECNSTEPLVAIGDPCIIDQDCETETCFRGLMNPAFPGFCTCNPTTNQGCDDDKVCGFLTGLFDAPPGCYSPINGTCSIDSDCTSDHCFNNTCVCNDLYNYPCQDDEQCILDEETGVYACQEVEPECKTPNVICIALYDPVVQTVAPIPMNALLSEQATQKASVLVPRASEWPRNDKDPVAECMYTL